MLWSKVKTAFIIAFLVLDIAFLALMGISSAGSRLTPDELSEIITLCKNHGITVAEETIPAQITRLPLMESRFLTETDLPVGVRDRFLFDGTGQFTYQNSLASKTKPKDEKAARKLVTETLKEWGIDPATFKVEIRNNALEAEVYYFYQNRPVFDCTVRMVLSQDAVVSAQGKWLWDVSVTQGAETILDAPAVLAKLIEEDELCNRGLEVEKIEVGYLPESSDQGVIHKIFPLSPAYRITLSDKTVRTYFAFSE